jgi:hypothetical protein
VPNSNIPEKQFWFSLTAPPPPPAPLAVAIAVSSVPCGGLLQTKPQSGTLAYAVPSAFQFFPADRSLLRMFFLRGGSTGCFNITIAGSNIAVSV